ncbi:uncharacterized protein [Lolium perenne]|uniref:uncharacterized protein n=1 Tax=Lolium perenne TaxID=4522 RepID=UPI0021EB3D6E|nr:peamaclein-like [Lolium perenne]
MTTSKNKPSGSTALQVALLVVLLVAASRLQACDAAPGFCASKCAVRCGKGKGKGPACMKHCGQCCVECACVPAGTGRIDDCPCYRDMLTAGPRKWPKCP